MKNIQTSLKWDLNKILLSDVCTSNAVYNQPSIKLPRSKHTQSVVWPTHKYYAGCHVGH